MQGSVQTHRKAVPGPSSSTPRSPRCQHVAHTTCCSVFHGRTARPVANRAARLRLNNRQRSRPFGRDRPRVCSQRLYKANGGEPLTLSRVASAAKVCRAWPVQEGARKGARAPRRHRGCGCRAWQSIHLVLSSAVRVQLHRLLRCFQGDGTPRPTSRVRTMRGLSFGAVPTSFTRNPTRSSAASLGTAGLHAGPILPVSCAAWQHEAQH